MNSSPEPSPFPIPSPNGSLQPQMPRRLNRSKRSEWPFTFPLWCYVIVYTMLLIVVIWVFVLLTLRTINQLAYWTTEGWFVGWGWAGLTTLALGWAVLNVRWARLSLLELKVIESYAHWAIAVCCGAASIGLHFISAAKSYNEGPNIIDPQGLLPAESTEESLSGPIYGRVNRGKAWFSLTCVTCHGPTGDGIANLAPSLKESEFLRTADAVDINLLIRRGRAAHDPLNKSGKPMPPRGGDVTITDEKLADLVAFVMSLRDRTAEPELLTWEGVDAPPPTVSAKALKVAAQNPVVRQTGITALMTHAVFVGCLMISSLHLLFGWIRGWPTKRCRPWIFVNSWGWTLALAGWLATLFFLGMVDSQILEWLTG